MKGHTKSDYSNEQKGTLKLPPLVSSKGKKRGFSIPDFSVEKDFSHPELGLLKSVSLNRNDKQSCNVNKEKSRSSEMLGMCTIQCYTLYVYICI